MAPPKKAKKDAPPIAEGPAVHDVELHTAARADGLDQGIDPETKKRVMWAVPGCQVCEALVEDGFSKFPPTKREFVNRRDGTGEHLEDVPATPAPAVTIVEPDAQAGLAAFFEAAETFKPGLADKLAPVVEMAMKEWAKGQEQERAVAAWQAAITEDLRLMKEAISVLHNNMSYLYTLETENVLVDLLRIKRALNIKMEK